MAHGTCRECGKEDRHLPGRRLCAGCYDRRWRSGDWGDFDVLPLKRPVPTYTEKSCAICRVVKPLAEFGKNKNRPDGHGSYCKPCTREKYHAPNRERKRQIERPTTGTRACTKCAETKPVDNFYWQADKGKFASACISCKAQEGQARWRRSGSDKQRQARLDRYGLTSDAYAAMLANQDGGCAICGRTPTETGKRLAVDHCHQTGAVRALLCGRCNTGIGQFLEQSRLMRLAALYVEYHHSMTGAPRG